jgi:adenine deaminase
MHNREPWHAMTRDLVAVAAGRQPATLLVKNGRWVNVYSGEIIDNTDVAVCRSRIAYVGPDGSHTAGERAKVIDAAGRYLVPGLCDGHMHVESAMLTVTEYVRAVIGHGTTSCFIDPHEIANVLGLAGVRLMHDEAVTMPINVFVQMPSCVPSAPGLETPGAVLGPDEVAEAMRWPNIVGLGEMMNFPGVAAGDDKMHAELSAAMQAGKTVGGHYASPDLGIGFHAYLAGGPADDHEGTRLEDAKARVRRGMRAMLRYGSGWRDVAAQVTAITEQGLESRNFILCTDDCHAATLVKEGHMDRVVRHAIEQGLAPITAIQMATLNTAQHFGLERDIGSISPGRYADIVISSDLEKMVIDSVIAGGNAVVRDGRPCIELVPYKYPDHVRNTVKLKRQLRAEDFQVTAPNDARSVSLRVIGVIEHQAPTRALSFKLPVMNHEVSADLDQDVCQVSLVERHHGSGRVAHGFVHGFGFDRACAVASTVAHDSHQMIVVGSDCNDMVLAANRLAAVGGGVTVIAGGKELALVPLPIAGLMSNEPAATVGQKAALLEQALRACGCRLADAFMQLSLLALVVIPELRISDLGLVDVNRFEVVPLFDQA